MEIKIDREADAAYVRVSDAPVARTQPKTTRIIVDYDAGGNVRGIELLDVGEGVDFGTVFPSELIVQLERILTGHNIRVLVYLANWR
jgi:uncharacterized protein YuzE